MNRRLFLVLLHAQHNGVISIGALAPLATLVFGSGSTSITNGMKYEDGSQMYYEDGTPMAFEG